MATLFVILIIVLRTFLNAILRITSRNPPAKRFDVALFERALSEAWAEPARRFPHFGRIEAP